MRVQYSPDFYTQYKKVNMRIRNAVDKKIKAFKEDAFNLELNNHELHDEYEKYNSIDITNDYRALYEEIITGKEPPIAYFVLLGTHKKLYKQKEGDKI